MVRRGRMVSRQGIDKTKSNIIYFLAPQTKIVVSQREVCSHLNSNLNGSQLMTLYRFNTTQFTVLETRGLPPEV